MPDSPAAVIKAALGFSAVISSAHSWTYKARQGSDGSAGKGAQIDLLIDRNDDTINLCEMKYSKAQYTLTEEEYLRLCNRRETFVRETKTQKSVLLTMITTFGMTSGGYAGDIHCQVTMDDLFR